MILFYLLAVEKNYPFVLVENPTVLHVEPKKLEDIANTVCNQSCIIELLNGRVTEEGYGVCIQIFKFVTDS